MSSNLTEKEAELLAKKMIEQTNAQKQEKYNKIKSKMSDAKEFAFEAQEGSLLYIIKWTISFVIEMSKSIKEAISARKIERNHEE